MWDGCLSKASGIDHHIDLVSDAKLHRSVPYCAGIHMRDIDRAELDSMVAHGVAVPATPTHWEFPVVFAPKKEGKLRFSANYRRLNAMTVRDACLITRMDQCIDSLEDEQIFSALDASSGY